MNNQEKSAIDAIYEILNEIKQLRQEVSVINNDIKLLNNKVSKLSTPVRAVPVNQPTVTTNQTTTTSESNQLIKVFGKIKNQNQKPMKGVYVTVFKPTGETFKSRESDSEGYWEARIPPGQYVVELSATHLNNKFRPINIPIDINENMHEFEVKKVA